MRRLDLPARDLRLLDPLFVYPSAILGRERAVVCNLEWIRCIITADEALVLRDAAGAEEAVRRYVNELQRRLVDRVDDLPFEFVALEVALEAACSFLDSQMKKTVDIDNSDFLKDLENLSKKWELNPPGKLIVDFVDGIELPPGLGSLLERLGLFMKKDLEEEVEHEMEDSISPSVDAEVEEGEISCCR